MADLEYRCDDGVATIVLNRPEKKNAFTAAMLDHWVESLRDVRDDPAVRVLVLRGAGDAFCAGVDLGRVSGEMGQTPWDQKELLRTGVQRIPLLMQELDKPTIASVNGVAVGAGIDMALMCDMRLGARSARVCESYIRMGFVPGAGGLHLLPRVVGTAKAFEMFLTGDFYDAEQALQMGLFNHVYDDDELLDATYALAGKLASAPPAAVSLMKRALYQSLELDLRTSLDLISSHMGVLRSTDVSKDIVSANHSRYTRG